MGCPTSTPSNSPRREVRLPGPLDRGINRASKRRKLQVALLLQQQPGLRPHSPGLAPDHHMSQPGPNSSSTPEQLGDLRQPAQSSGLIVLICKMGITPSRLQICSTREVTISKSHFIRGRSKMQTTHADVPLCWVEGKSVCAPKDIRGLQELRRLGQAGGGGGGAGQGAGEGPFLFIRCPSAHLELSTVSMC